LLGNNDDNIKISNNTWHNIVYNISDGSHREVKKIHIPLDGFDEAFPFDIIQEKWFINLNNIDIPIDIQFLLQLEEKFELSINKNNFDRTLVEFIKYIENNVILTIYIVLTILLTLLKIILHRFLINSIINF